MSSKCSRNYSKIILCFSFTSKCSLKHTSNMTFMYSENNTKFHEQYFPMKKTLTHSTHNMTSSSNSPPHENILFVSYPKSNIDLILLNTYKSHPSREYDSQSNRILRDLTRKAKSKNTIFSEIIILFSSCF